MAARGRGMGRGGVGVQARTKTGPGEGRAGRHWRRHLRARPARPGPAGAPLFSPRSSHATSALAQCCLLPSVNNGRNRVVVGILVLPANLPRSGSLGTIGLSF